MTSSALDVFVPVHLLGGALIVFGVLASSWLPTLGLWAAVIGLALSLAALAPVLVAIARERNPA